MFKKQSGSTPLPGQSAPWPPQEAGPRTASLLLIRVTVVTECTLEEEHEGLGVEGVVDAAQVRIQPEGPLGFPQGQRGTPDPVRRAACALGKGPAAGREGLTEVALRHSLS